jgi:signal transduction histidine kinase
MIERKKVLREALDRMIMNLGQLRQLSDYVVGYTSAARRRDRQPQPLSKVINDFRAAFDGLLKQRSIKSEAIIEPRSLRTLPMARSELEAILFNLLSNAVKAIERGRGETRLIRLYATPSLNEADVVLSFQDSGSGIDPSIAQRIFDPFITSSTSSAPELGTGTGLGLTVVRDLVESYGGSVGVGKPDDDMKTNIQVVIPRLESQVRAGVADDRTSS